MAPERVLRSTPHANSIVRRDESRRVLSSRSDCAAAPILVMPLSPKRSPDADR
jgi:hypothetical protein